MKILLTDHVYFDDETPTSRLSDKNLYDGDEQGDTLFGDANYEEI
jgi:hypothetical protein